MQKGNDNSRRIITSVEVVDVPPIETESYVTTSAPNESTAGVTQLTKEEVYQFFNGRNLSFCLHYQKMALRTSLQFGQRWSTI